MTSLRFDFSWISGWPKKLITSHSIGFLNSPDLKIVNKIWESDKLISFTWYDELGKILLQENSFPILAQW